MQLFRAILLMFLDNTKTLSSIVWDIVATTLALDAFLLFSVLVVFCGCDDAHTNQTSFDVSQKQFVCGPSHVDTVVENIEFIVQTSSAK